MKRMRLAFVRKFLRPLRKAVWLIDVALLATSAAAPL